MERFPYQYIKLKYITEINSLLELNLIFNLYYTKIQNKKVKRSRIAKVN